MEHEFNVFEKVIAATFAEAAAKAVVFLASEDAAACADRHFVVDGGRV